MASVDVQVEVLSSFVTLLLATVLVYVAARLVLDRSSLLASLAVVVLGTLLAAFVARLLPGVPGLALAAAAWALAAALFFRTRWVKGAIIGLVAWALWVLVRWTVDQVS